MDKSSNHKIKVLFLDVDGVLNNLQSLKSNKYALDDEKLRILSTIVHNTDSKIVLSTTWRLHSDARNILTESLEKYGINKSIIAGMTRNLAFAKRTDEILEWLFRNPNVSAWAAVDDMDLMSLSPSKFKAHFVKTDTETGLTLEHAKEIQKILGISKVLIKSPDSNQHAKIAEALSRLSPKTGSRKRSNSIISAGTFQKHFIKRINSARC